MIYYTSDLHLGHANAIRLCGRPFANIEEMDEALIANWNKVVHKNDTVYIVGDLMFRQSQKPEAYLERLKGVKYLITGNHDKTWIKKAAPESLPEICPFMETNDAGRKVVLCHYPLMTWPGMNKGAYMVFGHIHHNTDADYWPYIEKNDHLLNAGVDINGFTPVTLDQMAENNQEHKMQTAAKQIIRDNRAAIERLVALESLVGRLDGQTEEPEE